MPHRATERETYRRGRAEKVEAWYAQPLFF
jgi:hypothetical protein